MSKISLMELELANQIAAGEVIERPSSVVKELVENSIDANATQIDIHIFDAGRSKIIVSDNGEGMDQEDAKLAFSRHATSKLLTTYDLFRIKTLGFRGEALPSIASIAKVSLETAQGGHPGTIVSVINSELTLALGPKRNGTTISVEELFYNTPARLKYLKLDYTENAVTLDVVTKIALAHPNISFSLYFDDKLRFKTAGRDDLKETIMNVYGTNTVRNMLPIDFSTPDFKVSGFLGNSELVRSNRYGIIINLNGRNVYMPKIQNAIIEAYHNYIAPTRFPFVILNFWVEHELVDVNVHPSKKEVRFSKEMALRQALIEQIPLFLSSIAFAPSSTESKFSTKQSQTETNKLKSEQTFFNLESTDSEKSFLPLSDSYISETEEKQLENNGDEVKINSFLTPLTAIHDTYIVGEDNEGGFWLIDQHAAHERINYEKFQRVLNKDLKTRPLLVPYILNLSSKETMQINNEAIEKLATVGIIIEPFGSKDFRVIAVPVYANEYDERIYIDQVIQQVLETRNINTQMLRTNAIAMMACKASIKAKQRLNHAEMHYLLNELFICENPYSCPHGRPTLVRFSKYELEKMFKRTGT